MDTGASAFWKFSLRFYQQPAVAPLCIALQDQRGVDVNFLFFILYLALNGRCLSTDEVRRIDATLRDWRLRIVQPLRAIRRELKIGIAPVATADSAALRSAIQRDELLAERLQQEALEREFPLSSIGSAATLPVAATANIVAYGTLLGEMSGAMDGTLPQTAVDTLLKALAVCASPRQNQ